MIEQIDLFNTTPIDVRGTYSTQIAKVRAYMAKWRALDTVAAVMQFNCLRLGSIVYKLKHRDGWIIRKATKEDGWDKIYAKYIVEKVGV